MSTNWMNLFNALNVPSIMDSLHAKGAADMSGPATHDAAFRSFGDFRDWLGDACHRIAGKTGTYRAEQASENAERHNTPVLK
jgi:hypothetical protein